MTAVGITQRSLPPNEFGERRYALDVRWFPFLAACGLTAVPLPNVPGAAVGTAVGIAEELGLCGVILSGGDDLACYGGPCPERDETERQLLAWAMRRDLPVLGVCRGMQLLVDAFGGTLAPVDGHVATRHDVRTAAGVRNVNSYHRLAAHTVPPVLEVTASCADVVEGVRHRAAAVHGVMWHAEREDVLDEQDVTSTAGLFRR
jgi:gamma-glutamyl-gamma-aminobutyrate hydrolase PuuD